MRSASLTFLTILVASVSLASLCCTSHEASSPLTKPNASGANGDDYHRGPIGLVRCGNEFCRPNQRCSPRGHHLHCEDEDGCEHMCNRPTRPSWVCGSDFITYQSFCDMIIKNCRTGTNVHAEYEHPCHW